jgi:hypothetical protein
MDDAPPLPEQLAVPLPQLPVRPPTTTSPSTPPQVDNGAPRGRAIQDAVLAAAAQSLADEVRSTLPEALWPQMLDELRRRLDVSGDDLLDYLE